VWSLAAACIAAVVVFAVFAAQVQAAIPANGRAWEIVTEPQPSSSGPLDMRPMDNDGERLIYGTFGPPPGGPSGAVLGYAAAVRGPAGWVNAPLGVAYHTETSDPNDLLVPLLPTAFSSDERTVLWIATVPLAPGAPPDGQLALYRQVLGGAPQLIAKVGEGHTNEDFKGFADIAGDGSRVVFTTAEHLLSGDAGRTQGESIYAWSGGAPALVDVDNGGALLSTCGVHLSHANGMSAAATRVFFTTSSACGLEKVYMRNLQTGKTVEISASKCTRVDCNAPADATFAGATADGRFAYFTTTQQLTNADEDSSRDLYRYDAGTETLSLVSAAPSAVSGEVSQAQVVPSEDGSHVYFRASGEMIPGEATTGEKLFVADASGLQLVAKGPVAELLGQVQIQLSTDGTRALFLTQAQLVGTDTDSQRDAYLYDADAKTVTLVSRGPSGGNASLPVSIEAPTPLNNHEFEYGNVRPYYAIDAAGDRVFFQTEEQLVPEDTNGRFDVYEWVNGAVGLISPGNQPLKSDFAGISRDGRSAVFATNAALVPADQDGESRDLYVARIGGGFPEAASPPECDTNGCPLPASGGRITRPTPATLSPDKAKGGGLRLLDVAAKAKKGAIAVTVSAPAPGLVTGVVSGRQGGKKVVLARGSARAKHPGKVELSLRLTAAAHRAGGKGAGKLQLTVSEGSAKATQQVKVSLR
jgi:hypothetical protein